jgi:hypothetical protein
LATNTALAESVPHAADLQQRARLAMSLMTRDVARAGSGLAYGRFTGSLARAFPAIQPRRMGLTGADPFSTARPDVITLLWASSPNLATETTTAVAGMTPVVAVKDAPNCAGIVSCGVTSGATIVIFDEAGRYGLYAVTASTGAAATLRSLQASPSSFPARALVLPIESRTYAFDAVARQLRSYDGYLSDAVVVDDVVEMEVAYVGDGSPPTQPKPAAGTDNCLYDAAGNLAATLTRVPTAGDSLAPLPLALFDDGPWCGEGDRRFDVDLMRVRGVRLRLRLQAAPDQVRAAGIDFRRPGTNTRPLAMVTDLTLSSEVMPWNLNTGR